MIRLELALPVSKNDRHMPIKCGKWFKEVRTSKARRALHFFCAIRTSGLAILLATRLLL